MKNVTNLNKTGERINEQIMARTMRAAVFQQFGGPETLQLTEVPMPTNGSDEVLVRVRAVGLNRLDLLARSGQAQWPLGLPRVGGSEIAGEVVQRGEQVRGFEPGQPVVIAPYLYDNTCANCRAGETTTCENGGLIGVTHDGGLAEYVVVPSSNLVKIPEEISFEEAAALSLTAGMAWRMLVGKAGVRPGEVVAVLAAGSGVGSGAIQIAKLWGAQVIAIGRDFAKLKQAQEIGADEVINYTEVDFLEEIQQITQKRGADIVVETVGAETWDKSVAALACNGRLVMCGTIANIPAQINLWDIVTRQLMLIGSHGCTAENIGEVLRFASEGRLNAVIDKVYPLEQIGAAHTYLEKSAQFGKVLITI